MIKTTGSGTSALIKHVRLHGKLQGNDDGGRKSGTGGHSDTIVGSSGNINNNGLNASTLVPTPVMKLKQITEFIRFNQHRLGPTTGAAPRSEYNP